jgi:hypothetical protein
MLVHVNRSFWGAGLTAASDPMSLAEIFIQCLERPPPNNPYTRFHQAVPADRYRWRSSRGFAVSLKSHIASDVVQICCFGRIAEMFLEAEDGEYLLERNGGLAQAGIDPAQLAAP